jgi:hypothetical protein
MKHRICNLQINGKNLNNHEKQFKFENGVLWFPKATKIHISKFKIDSLDPIVFNIVYQIIQYF